MKNAQRITNVQVCAAVQDAQGAWPAVAAMDTPAQVLHRRTGEPRDVCQRAIDNAFDDGLLCTGVSKSRPTLTKAGAELLSMTEALDQLKVQQRHEITLVNQTFEHSQFGGFTGMLSGSAR